MRFAMRVTGALLALGLTGSAGALAQTAAPQSAPPKASVSWCGFHDKAGARVRCGFSSHSDCKQTLGDKGTICIVDPYRA
jgi:hypothetical protein